MVDLTCYEKFLQPALETNPSVNSIIIPSLQMTELRHREVKQPVQATQLQSRFESWKCVMLHFLLTFRLPGKFPITHVVCLYDGPYWFISKLLL